MNLNWSQALVRTASTFVVQSKKKPDSHPRQRCWSLLCSVSVVSSPVLQHRHSQLTPQVPGVQHGGNKHQQNDQKLTTGLEAVAGLARVKILAGFTLALDPFAQNPRETRWTLAALVLVTNASVLTAQEDVITNSSCGETGKIILTLLFKSQNAIHKSGIEV
ncbi:hypothetical protein MHYP_G00240690 [Metynnis hypsauchen]